MANSMIVGALKCGMSIACACPKDYRPAPEIIKFAEAYGDKFLLTESVEEAAAGADVLATDVWASMGQESEAAKRRAAFEGYQLNADVMNRANKAQLCSTPPCTSRREITEVCSKRTLRNSTKQKPSPCQKAVMTLLMADSLELESKLASSTRAEIWFFGQLLRFVVGKFARILS